MSGGVYAHAPPRPPLTGPFHCVRACVVRVRVRVRMCVARGSSVFLLMDLCDDVLYRVRALPPTPPARASPHLVENGQMAGSDVNIRVAMLRPFISPKHALHFTLPPTPCATVVHCDQSGAARRPAPELGPAHRLRAGCGARHGGGARLGCKARRGAEGGAGAGVWVTRGGGEATLCVVSCCGPRSLQLQARAFWYILARACVASRQKVRHAYDPLPGARAVRSHASRPQEPQCVRGPSAPQEPRPAVPCPTSATLQGAPCAGTRIIRSRLVGPVCACAPMDASVHAVLAAALAGS